MTDQNKTNFNPRVSKTSTFDGYSTNVGVLSVKPDYDILLGLEYNTAIAVLVTLSNDQLKDVFEQYPNIEERFGSYFEVQPYSQVVNSNGYIG